MSISHLVIKLLHLRYVIGLANGKIKEYNHTFKLSSRSLPDFTKSNQCVVRVVALLEISALTKASHSDTVDTHSDAG